MWRQRPLRPAEGDTPSGRRRYMDFKLSRVLSGERDALVEYVHRDIGFVFAYHQRRRDAYCARTATQKQDAAFEGQFDDAVALLRRIFLGLLVLNDFDADHQPAAPDVAY